MLREMALDVVRYVCLVSVSYTVLNLFGAEIGRAASWLAGLF
ncbi:hypothetical protein ACFCV3_41525 [Kribbella sp. NPDC056345]